MRLSGVSCLVTGASRGIGRAVAIELARRSCRVALVARDEVALDEVAAACAREGGQAHVFVADVTDESKFAEAVRAADAWSGGLRAAVVNAGVGIHGGAVDLPWERLHRTMEINLLGALRSVRLATPLLLRNAPSALVVMSSLSALIPYRGGGVYGASKAGMIAYLRCLRLELWGRGVTVAWLCPGAVDTGLIVEGIPLARLPRLSRRFVPVLPPERVAREVARAAEGRGGQRVIPASARLFAAFVRFFPRLGEWAEVATGAGEA